MKAFSYIVLTIVFVLVVTSCGSSSSSSTGVSDIASLPKTSGPVVSSSISRMFKIGDFVRPGFLQAATTGTLLKDWDTTTWSSSTSGALCNKGNMVKNLLKEAMQADKILCYVGKMQSLGLFSVDPFTGSNVYYQITFTDPQSQQTGTMKVKFLGTKSGGNIATFKMHFCDSGQTSVSEYVNADFTNGATVRSVSTHNGGGFNGTQETDVTGTINSSGQWLTKVINHKSSFGDSNGSFKQKMTLTQYASYLTLSGWFSGTFGGQANVGRIYSATQTLNSSAPTTFALGEGTIKSLFTVAGTNLAAENVGAWDGDTRAPKTGASITAADYYAEVNAASLPATETITPGFQTGETWDCAAESGSSFNATTMTAANMTEVQTCNNSFGFGTEEGNWVNCSSCSY